MKTRNKKYTKELTSAVIKETHWYGQDDFVEDIFRAKPIKGSRLCAIFKRAEFALEYGCRRCKFDAMDSLIASIVGTRYGTYRYDEVNFDPDAKYYIWVDIEGDVATYGARRVRPKEWAWVVRRTDDRKIMFSTSKRDVCIAHADWAKEAYNEDFVVEYTEID